MFYEIIGGSFPAVNVVLNEGETVITQSGAMAWCDENIEMSTNAEGGLLKSLGRMFSGASLMFVRHTAKQDDSKITFSASFPGTIKEFEVDSEHEYFAQKSAFLVAEEGVNIDASVNKHFWSGLFGGEGFILQKFTGEGTLLAEIDGSVVEVDLKEGEMIKVETGHVALFEASCTYDVESVSGFKNMFFGGQGLFLTTLRGPGKVWLQTLTASDMASKLVPYLPSSSGVSVSSGSSSSSD
ncbi:MAG: TIGR00266 family protein [Erysipelotrichaceae bacterium]|nr:TIGR00266 family protein [Erysipelotrichaceae bacterium]MBQ1811537.1 TIGR00266 family protein [Erysipelotrichaceae bacterium]MBQ1910270.1 TIGR00266 family protein [Erysipelotrichaceae bacterium]MBQ2079736.1 TIGR00266 family protein [Erysipelotrichaceae bacterium]MBQ2138072.1 TIGR00266 family protein [Erysipelotrichaceae bacterium]